MSVADQIKVEASEVFQGGAHLDVTDEATGAGLTLDVDPTGVKWLIGKLMSAGNIEFATVVDGQIITKEKP